MAEKDHRIDGYIKAAQPFAQPILRHLRELVHKAVPDITETLKWGMPSFEYCGSLFSIAAFKQHAVFGFPKWTLINDPGKYLQPNALAGGKAMGNGGRITSLSDLPPDRVMLNFMKQAAMLNEKGIKPAKERKMKKEVTVPDDLRSALMRNKTAWENFDAMPPSHKREYIEWITEARREETRTKRTATAIDWITGGKSRNWKYER